MTDELQRLRTVWGMLGEDDPLWAILSRPDKRGRRWEHSEFFAAGAAEVDALQALCTRLGRPRQHRLALDFGCGIGRLSRALSKYYANVLGVDISPSMIAHARQLNADLKHVRFVENARPDLAFVEDGSVDLVYSVITLHHMPARLQRGYVVEFLRVLAPDGVAVFQFAGDYASGWPGWGYRMIPNRLLAPLRRGVHGSVAAAEMHVLAESEVVALADAASRRVLHAQDVDSAGRGFRGRLICLG